MKLCTENVEILHVLDKLHLLYFFNTMYKSSGHILLFLIVNF
jgi:hypothetical protein